MTVMKTKTIFVSKTFWLNVIGISIAIFNTLQPEVIGIETELLALILGILNILNRFLTNGSVNLVGTK